jgi:hypothetical protein
MGSFLDAERPAAPQDGLGSIELVTTLGLVYSMGVKLPLERT